MWPIHEGQCLAVVNTALMLLFGHAKDVVAGTVETSAGTGGVGGGGGW